MTREGFVGVHVGAGHHSEQRFLTYMGICSGACRVAVEVLKTGGSAVDAASAATAVLENAPETNAGFGSNLTEIGTVEMDAGIMDGASLMFGSVGAIPSIKNPIMVAKLLLQEQNSGLMPMGRLPSGSLIGESARNWAVRHNVTPVPPDTLITQKSWKLYRHFKTNLERYHLVAQHERVSGLAGLMPVHHLDDNVYDTVGVVVMDQRGNTASTVSSGGVVVKRPGRLGPAACFGCGCWAQNGRARGPPSVGVSTTGCGEHILRSILARECALEVSASLDPFKSLGKVMREKFVESPFLANAPDKFGGAICLCYDETARQGQFLWSHTTPSMGVACQTTADRDAFAKISVMPSTFQRNTVGSPILVGGVSFSNSIVEQNSSFVF